MSPNSGKPVADNLSGTDVALDEQINEQLKAIKNPAERANCGDFVARVR